MRKYYKALIESLTDSLHKLEVTPVGELPNLLPQDIVGAYYRAGVAAGIRMAIKELEQYGEANG